MNRLTLIPILALAAWGCNQKAAAPSGTEEPKTDAPKQEQKPAEPKAVPIKFNHDGARYYGFTNPNPVKYRLIQGGAAVGEGTSTIQFKSGTDAAQTFSVTRDGSLEMLGTESVELNAKGVFSVSTSSGTYDSPVMELPADVAPGKTWTQDTGLNVGTGKVKMKLSLKAVGEETVKTDLGDKTALKVTGTGSMVQAGKTFKIDATAWYVKDFGFVRQIIKSDAQSTTVEVAK